MNNKTEKAEKELYVVLTHTGTILSEILKLLTGAEYNHASLSLEPELKFMYSFGRRNPYNAFWGGYIREEIGKGTYKRFPKTNAAVLRIKVTEQQYNDTKKRVETMYENKSMYHYNTLGLFTSVLGKNIKIRDEYDFYCSEFVREMLVSNGVAQPSAFPEIIIPIDIYNAYEECVVYKGKLREYSKDKMVIPADVEEAIKDQKEQVTA